MGISMTKISVETRCGSTTLSSSKFLNKFNFRVTHYHKMTKLWIICKISDNFLSKHFGSISGLGLKIPNRPHPDSQRSHNLFWKPRNRIHEIGPELGCENSRPSPQRRVKTRHWRETSWWWWARHSGRGGRPAAPSQTSLYVANENTHIN